MKKLILLAAAVTFAFAANAKVWRINYDENANADFQTITAACSSAKVANTDTLYCEPGNHAGSESDNVISRKGMKVFGPGWGFEPNYGGTSTIADARFSARVRVAANNVYVSGIVGDGDLEIEVSTVHAVKGETHASTLYLETSYFGKHESERLADQFKGIAYADNNTQILKSLKVAYVGLSRPRYLLCVAIQKSRFNNIDCAELREIWDVVEA